MHEWSKECGYECSICNRAADKMIGYDHEQRRQRYDEMMEAKIPVGEYVEQAIGELEQMYPPKPERRSMVKQSSKAIRLQQARVQALLDAPGETDWAEYEQEVGILLHMMPEPEPRLPVEAPIAPPERLRDPKAWLTTSLSLVGLSGVLWTSFFGHADPEMLMLFTSLLGIPAFLRTAVPSDKL